MRCTAWAALPTKNSMPNIERNWGDSVALITYSAKPGMGNLMRNLLNLGQHLSLYPLICLGQARFQADGRFPAKILLDLSVVAISSVYALRSIQIILPFELDTGNFFGDVH